MYLLIIILVVCVWFLFRKTLSKHFNYIVSSKVENIITLFFVVFGISCSLFYLKNDNKGYNYGLDCNFCDTKMPYHLKPVYNSQFPQSFYLFDDDDFELVGAGFKFRETEFKIKKFIAYGYNDTSVIVKCTDSLNTIKYLISYETGYKSKKGNPEISFKCLSNSDFDKVKDKYQWFDIDKEKVYAVGRNKFLSMLGFFLSFVFVVWRFFKLISNKAPALARIL